MIAGAQIVLDPASAASQGARGVYNNLEHNTQHRDAGYIEMGLDPADPGSEPGGGAPATEPPANVDVPFASQEGAVLTVTMGNWTGEPTSYAYAWQMDGAAVGTDAATYDVQAGDVGHTATCVVTATNAAGSTAAPPSNGVLVA
jgi:hypothetical protein